MSEKGDKAIEELIEMFCKEIFPMKKSLFRVALRNNRNLYFVDAMNISHALDKAIDLVIKLKEIYHGWSKEDMNASPFDLIESISLEDKEKEIPK